MITHLLTRLGRVLVLAGLVGGIGSMPVLAQSYGGPPPGMGGGSFSPGGRPPGFGGPPPGGPHPGGPPVTPASLPLNALASDLHLTAPQQAKIGQIQQQFQKQRRAMMPAPGKPSSGPPNWQAMDQSRNRMMALDQKASGAITALLTVPQKQALPRLLKGIDAARSVGIPPQLYGSLKLSADQKQRIATLAQATRQGHPRQATAPQNGNFQQMDDAMRQDRERTTQKAMALLTATQKAQVKKFQQTHPRFGGFGPPPGGGGPPHGGFGPPPGEGGPPPGGFGPPPGGGGPPPSGGRY